MIIFLTNLVKTLFNRQIRLSQILAPVFQYIRKPTIPTYSLEISTNFEKGCREDYFEAPECFLFKHRQIINSVLIANKLLDSSIRSSEPSVLCKLDTEKTYDHVNWEFFLYLLGRCDFGEKLRNWMAYCISLVRFSTLVNYTHFGFSSNSCGLRYGDPLSSMLFIIVMEALSKMKTATRWGLSFKLFCRV